MITKKKDTLEETGAGFSDSSFVYGVSSASSGGSVVAVVEVVEATESVYIYI